MCVVLSKESFQHPGPGKEPCFNCGERLWHPPFVVWRGAGGNLYFCGECCSELKTSMAADFVHAAAIRSLHQLGYRTQTLSRDFEGAVEKKDRAASPFQDDGGTSPF